MMLAFLGLELITLISFASSTSALKILAMTTLPTPSHHMWFTELMNGLARNGHEIYAVSLQQTEFEGDKFKENQTTSIVFEGMLEGVRKDETFDPLEWARMSPIEFSLFLYQESPKWCEVQMATQGAKQLLELVKSTRFDVVLHDLMAGQCFYGLLETAEGNPPLVGLMMLGQANWIKDIVGGNDWLAIKPYSFYRYMPPFNLWQKTWNFIYSEFDNFVRQYHYLPQQQEIAEKFIGKKLSKSINDIEKTMSLVLINSYAALEPAIYLPPNAIEVGGLHVKNPKPLPQDIQAFIDGAEHGVVVMSLGTNVKTSLLGQEKLKSITTALGQLKQRVLWKFDDDHLADKPENVMIKKWLPQSDILAHPKVRVLWTHCGLMSTQEAVWRGIPVIGMPFFMDQYGNSDLLVKKGVALVLDFKSLTSEIILETFDRILTDPSFSLRMKQLSKEYRDRPMSPMDLAVWHVEYAARHPRGPLASAGRNLNRLQLNLLDVYAILAVAVLLVFWSFWFLLRTLLNLFCKQRKNETAQRAKSD